MKGKKLAFYVHRMARTIFDSHDKDRSGYLDYKEFRKFVKDVTVAMKLQPLTEEQIQFMIIGLDSNYQNQRANNHDNSPGQNQATGQSNGDDVLAKSEQQEEFKALLKKEANSRRLEFEEVFGVIFPIVMKCVETSNGFWETAVNQMAIDSRVMTDQEFSSI